MKASVKFIGTTSTGKGFKYEVINPTPEIEGSMEKLIASIEKEGLVFNKNLGVVGFISQTHCYLTPEIGKIAEVDLKGYVDQRTDRQINFFADLDKTKQKVFAEKQLVKAEVASIVAVEDALTDANSSLDVEKFEKIRLLKLQQKKLAREIALLGED